MRGKLLYIFIALLGFGITPADAGKTHIQHDESCHSKDHPRGCGENGAFPIFAPHFIGSPPRMRGKRDIRTTPRVTLRITPADAGKTRCLSVRLARRRDHPRGCGENGIGQVVGRGRRGSPPRMRGKLHSAQPQVADFRITPADAGKTEG